MEKNEKKWIRIAKMVCKFLITVLTAACTAFGVEACTTMV